VEYTHGNLFGTEVVAAVCGVGKVNAAVCALTMLQIFGADTIVNTGVAGALDPNLEVGDIMVAQKVLQHDVDTQAVGDPRGFLGGLNRVFIDCDEKISNGLFHAANQCGANAKRGMIASGDQFIYKTEMKNDIIQTFGAAACEMEGAAIGQVCALYGVKFAVLRSISDKADGSADVSFALFAEKAAALSASILLKFIQSGFFHLTII
jgi:adenosylhomocysteine nucleosidase